MAELQDITPDDQPLLVADHLGKNYGRLTACRDVSFALSSGEVLAIVGESGSGKTAFAKAAARCCFGAESEIVFIDCASLQSQGDLRELLQQRLTGRQSCLLIDRIVPGKKGTR